MRANTLVLALPRPTCRFCGESDHTKRHGCWLRPGPEQQRFSAWTPPGCSPSSPGQYVGSRAGW